MRHAPPSTLIATVLAGTISVSASAQDAPLPVSVSGEAADFVLSLGLPMDRVALTPMFQAQRAIDDDRFGDFELLGLTASIAF